MKEPPCDPVQMEQYQPLTSNAIRLLLDRLMERAGMTDLGAAQHRVYVDTA